MLITPKYVMLNGGHKTKLDVYIPSALLDIDIPDLVWQSAIDEFNKQLNNRSSITTKINDVDIDIIKLESIQDHLDILRLGGIVMSVVVKENDIQTISNIHFILSGSLTFEYGTDKVESMIIKNITWGGDDSKKYKLIDYTT